MITRGRGEGGGAEGGCITLIHVIVPPGAWLNKVNFDQNSGEREIDRIGATTPEEFKSSFTFHRHIYTNKHIHSYTHTYTHTHN